MNAIVTFLAENRSRLGLDRHGADGRLSCVLLTPRFRASRHVVFLIARCGNSVPVLVAKTPRLEDDRDGIEREAAGLRTVQASRPGGFDSIPRLVALDDHRGRPVLVETALAGRPIDPATVRRSRRRSIAAAVDWLAELHVATRSSHSQDPGWFDRLVERPLCEFGRLVPPQTAADERLIERTRELAAPLRDANLPLVFEHGDLSHPNLLLLDGGGLGVLDWELAEPRGLPACDLFFFLTFVAFSLNKGPRVEDQTVAFHRAFFGGGAWAPPLVAESFRRMELPDTAVKPLLVLTWARWTANLARRLSAGPADEPLDDSTVEWLRGNRYYALWRHAVEYAGEW